ncbi:glutamate racemase [Microbacterium aquimaris]|uniref:glutamate racemase n=1 Tax=Microbacterium aquimaris TaxID=459816 RepID=UPI002AD52BF7|nr:glutamate racemase [Microbacterium aquimaris]MDZ8274797.1 glutamate racemase [Microbacterium aquimaris]
MVDATSPIGVIDSGVGGLTTVAQLSKLLPGENIIYCGDNGNAPYGNRTGEDIARLTTRMLEFLAEREVKMVAVACNTISATFDTPGLAGYENRFGFPVLSIIRAAAEDVVKLQYTRVGVIATAFTIASQCYPRLIDELEGDMQVYGEPSEKLAALIEQGDLASPAIDQEVQTHLDNLMGAHPDVKDIVLGCTHYPIVEDVFQRKAPHVAFINPAKAQARAIRLHLSDAGLLHHGDHDTVGSLHINTSGERPVYETVLSELNITRDYTLDTVDFGTGTVPSNS